MTKANHERRNQQHFVYWDNQSLWNELIEHKPHTTVRALGMVMNWSNKTWHGWEGWEDSSSAGGWWWWPLASIGFWATAAAVAVEAAAPSASKSNRKSPWKIGHPHLFGKTSSSNPSWKLKVAQNINISFQDLCCLDESESGLMVLEKWNYHILTYDYEYVYLYVHTHSRLCFNEILFYRIFNVFSQIINACPNNRSAAISVIKIVKFTTRCWYNLDKSVH